MMLVGHSKFVAWGMTKALQFEYIMLSVWECCNLIIGLDILQAFLQMVPGAQGLERLSRRFIIAFK